MFEKNIKRQMRIDKLVEFVSSQNYGKMLSYHLIKSIIEVNPQSPEGYHIINKANIDLVQYQKTMKTIIGQGRRILNPNEHLNESRNQAKKALRPIKKSIRTLSATNLDLLTESEKKKIISEANKYKIMKMVYEKVRKEPIVISDKEKSKFKIDSYKLIELFKSSFK